MDNKSTLEKWFHEVWTEESTTAIREMFVPDEGEKAHGLGNSEGLGPDEFIQFQQALLKLIKNVKVTINNAIEQQDKIVVDCTVTAVDRSTGKKPVNIDGCVIARIKDGKLKSGKNYFDFISLYESLGLLPDDTFAKCLCGTGIKA